MEAMDLMSIPQKPDDKSYIPGRPIEYYTVGEKYFFLCWNRGQINRPLKKEDIPQLFSIQIGEVIEKVCDPTAKYLKVIFSNGGNQIYQYGTNFDIPAYTATWEALTDFYQHGKLYEGSTGLTEDHREGKGLTEDTPNARKTAGRGVTEDVSKTIGGVTEDQTNPKGASGRGLTEDND